MHLTQIQINTLKSLFEPMDKNELNAALEMLLGEAFKREWDNEYQPPVAHLKSPVITESL